MKFNRFEKTDGTCIEEIAGQFRIGYSISDTMDFYDLMHLSQKEEYQGSTISFYDYESGKIYQPFPKQKNVLYAKPVYLKNHFYFLQGDFNNGKLSLFQYLPGETPEIITQLELTKLNLYNLQILGEDVCILSNSETICCYYPEQFSFPCAPNESAIMIKDKKIYLSAWVEEGWDEENDCAAENYKYYEKMIIRDFDGTLLWEEPGSLHQHSDGTWWIS